MPAEQIETYVAPAHPPTTPGTAPASDGAAVSDPADVARLIDFLRDRDVPCPLCGYNLRNLTGDTCPECREPLSLTVGVRDIRFGWFLATVAPGIFSGIAAMFLAIPVFGSLIVGGPGSGPPWQIWTVDLFGFASGITAVMLIIRRRRFLRLLPVTQRTWAALAWTVHVMAFIVFLASTF